MLDSRQTARLASALFHRSIRPSWAETEIDSKQFTATRLINQPIVHPDLTPRLQLESKEYGFKISMGLV